MKRRYMAREWSSLRTIIYSNFYASTDLYSDRSLGFEFTPFSPKDAIFIIPDRAAREDHYEYIKEDFYNRLIDGVLYSKRIE
jgi:hypothetical protein